MAYLQQLSPGNPPSCGGIQKEISGKMKYRVLLIFLYMLHFLFLPIYAEKTIDTHEHFEWELERSQILPLFEKTTEKVEPLSLETVIESVEKNFPLILAAERFISQADFELLVALGAFDLQWQAKVEILRNYYNNEKYSTTLEKPTEIYGISLFGGYRLTQGQLPVYDGKYETARGGALQVGARFPLWRDFFIDRRRAGERAALLQRENARLALDQLRLELVRQASHRYWDWVAAGRRYMVARQLYDNALQRDAQLAVRVKSGDLPQVELTDNRRAILQREAQLLEAERNLQNQALELSIFLRSPEWGTIIPQPSFLPDDFPTLREMDMETVEADIQDALQLRPEIKKLQNDMKLEDIEIELQQNNQKPGVDLVVAASQPIGPGGAARTKTEFEANVVLTIPLQTRVADGRLGAARERKARAELQLALLKDRIAVEIKDAASAVEAARRRVLVAIEELRLARNLEEAERVRFNLGDGNMFLVNLREQATFEAALREIQAQSDHQKALATYRYAIAELLALKKVNQ
ncbi:MAG: TolC family protein [Leptospiraceae bacterium]|nr:TolC family protein [Leptospiraceae bacterium]